MCHYIRQINRYENVLKCSIQKFKMMEERDLLREREKKKKRFLNSIALLFILHSLDNDT